jgi:hypothetical protein
VTNSEYSRQQLITALQKEYEYLIHDEFDPEEDMSSEEHLESVKSLTLEAIKEEILESIEADNDNQDESDSISVSDYMNRWLY